jgi:hypothetical protein
MARKLLVVCLMGAAAFLGGCGDDDPAAPGAPVTRVLATGSWVLGGCWGVSSFDEARAILSFIGPPGVIIVMDETVAAGDENGPAGDGIIVLDTGHPSFAAVVERLTNGNADEMRAGFAHVSGASSVDQTEKEFFDLILAEDLAGRNITGLRFVVENAAFDHPVAGQTCPDVRVRVEVLGN